MSDKDNSSQDNRDQTHDIRESIIEIEKRLLKLTSIQTILSVAAVFTGVIALYAALTESYAVRKQTAASVWPYVQTVVRDTNNSESAYIMISLDNVGVGPARMHGARVRYKGEYIQDWDSFIHRLDGEAELGVTYGKSDVQDRVLAPQESLTIFQTENAELARRLQDAINQGDLGLSYCYCSIFDDCWLKPLPDREGKQNTQAVEQCPSSMRDSQL